MTWNNSRYIMLVLWLLNRYLLKAHHAPGTAVGDGKQSKALVFKDLI